MAKKSVTSPPAPSLQKNATMFIDFKLNYSQEHHLLQMMLMMCWISLHGFVVFCC